MVASLQPKRTAGISEQQAPGGFHVLWPRPLASHEWPATWWALSDLHLGSSHVDSGLLQAELDRCRLEGGRVLLNGDLFDLILPGDHKRFRQDALHPRLWGVTDIHNKVLDWAVELLEPLAPQIDFIGLGNHETCSEKIHSLDLVLLLCDRLNAGLRTSGSTHSILYGGYSGFCVYRDQLTWYYHHGWGGGSGLKEAAGDLDRILASVEGIDVAWLGHRHARMSAHVARISPPQAGFRPVTREVRFVRSGSYLRAHWGAEGARVKARGRSANYAVDAGLVPTGLGGAKITLDVPGGTLRIEQ
jgi:hypothetical protein